MPSPLILKPATSSRSGKVTGFNSYSTYKGPPLPRSFVRDAAAILERIPFEGTTGRFLKVMELVKYHVDNKEPNPHGIAIEQFFGEIEESLFHAYRLSGMEGSKDDMWRALFTFVPLLTNEELLTGENDNKAVNAVQFGSVFKEHEENRFCHGGIFSRFMYASSFDHDPVIHLSSFFKDTRIYKNRVTDSKFIYPMMQNTLVNKRGTMVVDFTFTHGDEEITICKMRGWRGNLRIVYTPTSEIMVRQLGYTGDKNLFRWDVPHELTRFKVAIGFNDGTAFGRASLGEFSTATYVAKDFEYYYVELPDFNDKNSKVKVKSFTYYNQVADTEPELIFLLD